MCEEKKLLNKEATQEVLVQEQPIYKNIKLIDKSSEEAKLFRLFRIPSFNRYLEINQEAPYEDARRDFRIKLFSLHEKEKKILAIICLVIWLILIVILFHIVYRFCSVKLYI